MSFCWGSRKTPTDKVLFSVDSAGGRSWDTSGRKIMRLGVRSVSWAMTQAPMHRKATNGSSVQLQC